MNKRTHPRIDRSHICTSWISFQISPSIPKNEFDFFWKSARLDLRLLHRCVGCSNNNPIMPWNDEEHASIVGMRHHNRALTGLQSFIKNQMHSLRRFDHPRRFAIIQDAQFIRKNTASVHHNGRANFHHASALPIHCTNTMNHSVGIFQQFADATLIENNCTQIRSGARESQRHTSIVELSIVIFHAAKQTFTGNIWNRVNRLGS